MKINEKEHNEVTITLDEIMLRFGDMEPVVIPRKSLRTGLRLLDWVYRLTAWPGMNVHRLRMFIAAVFRHHGWTLPEDYPFVGAGEEYEEPEIALAEPAVS